MESHGTNLAFFRGILNPIILVVAEAPGFEENKVGIPLVGRSGKLINRVFTFIGMSSAKVSYLNVVFRMPMNKDHSSFRKPTSEEIDYYRPMVSEIISHLNPQYILACGNSACESLLRKSQISKIRGSWEDNIMPTFHPSCVLRNPEKEIDFRGDVQAVVDMLLRTRACCNLSTNQQVKVNAKPSAMNKSEVKFFTSRNGNPTCTYRGFRMTVFGYGDCYIYYNAKNIGRMGWGVGDRALNSFKEYVDDYYDGVRVSYDGNRSWWYSGRNVLNITLPEGTVYYNYKNEVIEDYSLDRRQHYRIKHYFTRAEFIRDSVSYTITILNHREWSSNSGKTHWHEVCYTVHKNGDIQKPEDAKFEEPDRGTQPGLSGLYQSFEEDAYGCNLTLLDGDDSCTVRITCKIPGYSTTVALIRKLTVGQLVSTTVSNHNESWSNQKWFNSLEVIN